MRSDVVERLATVLVVLLTVVTLASLSVYSSLKTAVGDLHTQAANVVRDEVAPPRSVLGRRLFEALASDIGPRDAGGFEVRALELDHRADRLLEVTAVVALVGILVALLSGPPVIDVARGRDDRTPLASTSSNGTV
jgi:hypothetical protein